MDLRFTSEQMAEFLQDLSVRSIAFSLNEEGQYMTIEVAQGEKNYKFNFKKIGENYKLFSKNIQVADPDFAEIFQNMIAKTRGHAILKQIHPNTLVIHHIQFGEAVRITEICGDQRKVILDRGPSITIEQVMEALKRRDVEERLPVLRQEIDDELSKLSLLLAEGNVCGIEQSKNRLMELRKEMLLLEL